MNHFYSQHGEDFLLDKIFKGKNDGYFVEVGCLDGIEYSNTYHFENKGWKGLCVEAHNAFIDALTRNRPKSSIVHCAVGETNRDHVTFYANKVGSLSTLDKNEEARWRKNYSNDFYGFEEQQVSMRTLTSIFDELGPGSIDFVSLDIEGYEVKALQGLDFAKYRPSVFVIEYKDDQHKRQLEKILFKERYHFLSKVGCNLFYSTDIGHREILDGDYGKIQLIRVDRHGQEHRKEVNLSQPSFAFRIKSILWRIVPSRIWSLLRKYTHSPS